MKVHELRFSGALIERGFWLYIWRVTCNDETVLYVGRTGDSSSRYAASPFNRLGQHLDIRPNATANTLLRNIRAKGLDPRLCEYELVSLGPIYPEQETLEAHRTYRDLIGPLETALAQHLKARGHEVIGSHPSPRAIDRAVFDQILSMIEGKF